MEHIYVWVCKLRVQLKFWEKAMANEQTLK